MQGEGVRRSRIIFAVLLLLPAVVLLGIDFIYGMGLLWRLLAFALLVAGGFVFRAEVKRGLDRASNSG